MWFYELACKLAFEDYQQGSQQPDNNDSQLATDFNPIHLWHKMFSEEKVRNWRRWSEDRRPKLKPAKPTFPQQVYCN